jgi:hypothetical protein
MSMTPDHAFEAWLKQSGADRDWVRRNLPALKAQFRRDPQQPLIIPPAPMVRVRDRYEELD